MNGADKRNPGASVRARLLDLAHARGEEFQLVLTRYGLERLMYRLSKSPHADRFVLKGAMLFVLWSEEPHRLTRDVDFLGCGDMSEDALHGIFQDICAVAVEEDGVTFDWESVRVEPIRDDTEYGGMRVTLTGQLSGARIPVQADIGIGDAVTPGSVNVEYPVLLDGPAPALASYPRESVVAEKYQAMVALGIANSRMKDYYDLWVLAREYSFGSRILGLAIRNTFQRRRTTLPEETPVGLRTDFFGDSRKIAQWRAFLSRTVPETLESAPGLDEVCHLLEAFLEAPTRVAGGEDHRSRWLPGGPWT